MRSLVIHAVGGGWGKEDPADGLEQVAVIRGADFPDVAVGNASGLPVRWEEERKIPQRKLAPGDIVLEISGGSGDRPTGRTVFVSQELLNEIGKTTIPASFCRLVRIDATKADPRYVYWWLQSMYAEGRAWGYQNRSTGIANFQFEHFLDTESVSLPSLEEQRGIADTLGCLNDKIQSNLRAVTGALALARAYVDGATAGKPMTGYAEALEVRMGAAFKGEQFSAPGVGRPLLRIRDLKTFESQTWTTEVRKDETVIHPGDIVVGMDAEFRATLWLGETSVLNQRVCSFRGRGGVGRAFVLAALEPELAYQEQAKTGTTVIHLNKADIDSFSVPALSAEEHARLAEITEPLINLAVLRAAEARRLGETRDALLPELLSAGVSVLKMADVEEVTA